MMSDELFDRRIHDAYDQVELSDAAQDRMLAALLAAQEARAGEAMPTDGVPAGDAQGEVAQGEVAQGEVPGAKVLAFKPRRRVWLAALPLAAVLAVAVVVLSVDRGTNRAATSEMAVAEGAAAASDADAGVAATTSEPAAADEAPEAAAEEALGAGVSDGYDVFEPGAAGEGLNPAALFSRIVFEDGAELRVSFDEAGPVEVDSSQVGEVVGVARALPADAEESAPSSASVCTVFVLTDTPGAFAVRYEGDDSYWLCVAA